MAGVEGDGAVDVSVGQKVELAVRLGVAVELQGLLPRRVGQGEAEVALLVHHDAVGHVAEGLGGLCEAHSDPVGAPAASEGDRLVLGGEGAEEGDRVDLGARCSAETGFTAPRAR